MCGRVDFTLSVLILLSILVEIIASGQSCCRSPIGGHRILDIAAARQPDVSVAIRRARTAFAAYKLG